MNNIREQLAEQVWEGDFGCYKVENAWADVRIRRDGWPDQRFKRGREMAAAFKALDTLPETHYP